MRALAPFALCAVFLACSSSSSGGTSSSSGGGASGTVSGTLDKSAFTPVSGFANVHDGKIDLIWSSAADVCGAVTQNHVRDGEMLVQVYLTSTATGAHQSPDDEVKAAQIAQGCASGTPVGAGGSVAYANSASKTRTVTLDAVGATSVSGSIDATFDDGSTFKGTFTLPTCGATLTETAVCQ